eukprot:2792286-Amphidinium_carterae.2
MGAITSAVSSLCPYNGGTTKTHFYHSLAPHYLGNCSLSQRRGESHRTRISSKRIHVRCPASHAHQACVDVP